MKPIPRSDISDEKEKERKSQGEIMTVDRDMIVELARQDK